MEAFQRARAIVGMILEMPFIHAEKATGSLLGIQSNNAATTKQINFRLIRIKTSFGVERKMKRYYHYRPFRHSYKSSHLSWVQMEQDSTPRYRVQLSNSDLSGSKFGTFVSVSPPHPSAVLLNTVIAARWAIMIPVFTLIQATPPPPPSQSRRQRKVAVFLLVLVSYSDWKAGPESPSWRSQNKQSNPDKDFSAGEQKVGELWSNHVHWHQINGHAYMFLTTACYTYHSLSLRDNKCNLPMTQHVSTEIGVLKGSQ